jgi:hypothetical protein
MVHWWNQYLARYSSAISWTILALFVAAFAWGFWQWRRSGARNATAQAAHS